MSEDNQFIAETTFRVRYAETDAMGIVHHRNYLAYFEEGRSHYARLRGHPYSEFEREGYFLMVSEANLRFSRAAQYEQEITVRCWISEMKSRSLTFTYKIFDTDTGETLVTGKTKHICINREGKVTRIPKSWREWMN